MTIDNLKKKNENEENFQKRFAREMNNLLKKSFYQSKKLKIVNFSYFAHEQVKKLTYKAHFSLKKNKEKKEKNL